MDWKIRSAICNQQSLVQALKPNVLIHEHDHLQTRLAPFIYIQTNWDSKWPPARSSLKSFLIHQLHFSQSVQPVTGYRRGASIPLKCKFLHFTLRPICNGTSRERLMDIYIFVSPAFPPASSPQQSFWRCAMDGCSCHYQNLPVDLRWWNQRGSRQIGSFDFSAGVASAIHPLPWKHPHLVGWDLDRANLSVGVVVVVVGWLKTRGWRWCLTCLFFSPRLRLDMKRTLKLNCIYSSKLEYTSLLHYLISWNEN